jgi:hypothetical protein
VDDTVAATKTFPTWAIALAGAGGGVLLGVAVAVGFIVYKRRQKRFAQVPADSVPNSIEQPTRTLVNNTSLPMSSAPNSVEMPKRSLNDREAAQQNLMHTVSDIMRRNDDNEADLV